METVTTAKARGKEKGRWNRRQYSVAMLLAVVTIVGLVLGVVTNRAEQQRRAVLAIRELRGTLSYEFELPGRNSGKVRDWLRQSLGVDYGGKVVYVQASGLTRLERLTLDDTQVTDAGLAKLAGLTGLERLHLGGTRVTDAGLAHLAGLPNLVELALMYTRVTDEGRARLRQSLPNCFIQQRGMPVRASAP